MGQLWETGLSEMLRWKNKTVEAEKCSPCEEKHKVQLPSL